ncbi:hypothetical protein EIP91_003972 [Steccherinum ochraceum]|uniref:BZIP domain-containing protein n=1 Tax=Steccherinum ochraceum TaxID=92696 RepID=A0A4R0RSQ7_9APHY|nr:hypothetical protein EIP91_003972 [Steccherinum ochraceum]
MQHPPPPMQGLSLPPPHAMVQAHPHLGPPPPFPPGYQYMPSDFPPGAIPQMPPPPPPPGQDPMDGDGSQQGGGSRTLSQSKRAEQNRKAQRAFRERRDAHVKALESRSQLLDAALASADEANRRWEECRALVDQLRIENAALRSALNQAQMLNGTGGANGTDGTVKPADTTPATAAPADTTSASNGGEDNDGNAS